MKQTLLLLCGMLITAVKGDACACSFDSAPSREGVDCVVYGEFDGDYVAWHRASEPCLANLDIDMAAVDKQEMWRMCPFNNETDVDTSALINYLRDGNSTTVNTIRAMYPDFFQVSNDTAAGGLLNSITGGQAQLIDCTLSQKLCWSEISVYFGRHPGEEAKVCNELYRQEIPSLIREQGYAREKLCSMASSANETINANITTNCQSLLSQIQDKKNGNASSCSAFSADATNFTLPNCTKPTTTGTTSAAAAIWDRASYGGAALVSYLIAAFLV